MLESVLISKDELITFMKAVDYVTHDGVLEGSDFKNISSVVDRVELELKDEIMSSNMFLNVNVQAYKNRGQSCQMS